MQTTLCENRTGEDTKVTVSKRARDSDILYASRSFRLEINGKQSHNLKTEVERTKRWLKISLSHHMIDKVVSVIYVLKCHKNIHAFVFSLS